MIRVEQLSHYYGELAALDGLNFQIGGQSRGELGGRQVVGLLGLNGAGKSTLLKILAGICLPTRGQVFIDGHDLVVEGEQARRSIGFLPDLPPLYPEMRVEEYLRWCAELRGRGAAAFGEALPGVLARCQLEQVARTVIGELSHGYRKRVGIAQAVIHRPSLVLLDEPISGLDPVQIMEMRRMIRDLATEATVVVSSHILSEVTQTCDHLLVLERGRLRAQGPVEALLGDGGERSRFVLRGDEARVRAALASLEGVTAERLAIEARAGGIVVLDLPVASDAGREAAVAAFVAAGLGVREVRAIRPDLESLFSAEGGAGGASPLASALEVGA